MNDILDAIRDAIKSEIPDAKVRAEGGGGHFALEVTSEAFRGKNTIQKHRLVLGSIKHLMAGPTAPVHAIDSLKALVPESE